MPTEIEIDTKRVVRVRIEFADGTFSELDDEEQCRKWHQMSLEQAGNAAIHGYKGPELTWTRGLWKSQQICIIDPSDRVLVTPVQRNDEVVLFDTPEEARAHIAGLVKRYPNGGWSRCVVGIYTQTHGAHPNWEPYIGKMCSGCGHFHVKRYCGHEDTGTTCICDDPTTE